MSSRKQLSESSIVEALAAEVCRRISRRVIADLRRLDSGQLSGDDSGLRNSWEEICVQVQDQQSIFWDAYDTTLRSLLHDRVQALSDFEREALWLQTPEGQDWACEDDGKREPYPVFTDDIVAYLAESYIYTEAADWSNSRIRAYLEREEDYC